jgi:glucosamine-6-phosphate deaminase
MKVLILPDAEASGRAVADVLARAVEDAAATGERTMLGVATGSSPLPAYRELVRRHRAEGLSFAGVEVFLLDEYVGLPSGHPQAYRQVIRRELTDALGIDPAAVHGPDGAHPNPATAAAEYERALLKAGPLAVQLLGIGGNGHIGFNEPGSSLRSPTRVTTLTERTRSDNARFFRSLAAVPRRVITQGLETICRAEQLVLVAAGEAKAAAVAAAVEGPLSASCPASVLQWHPRATVVLDEAAAAQLRHGDHYRYAAALDPS